MNTTLELLQLLYQHISELLSMYYQNEKRCELVDLKMFYWILEVIPYENFSANGMQAKNELMEKIETIIKENNDELDRENANCDICNSISDILLCLLDRACGLTDEMIESMLKELDFFLFLVSVYDCTFGICKECNRYYDFYAVVKITSEYLEFRDMKKLRDDIFYWKKAINADEIFSHIDTIKKPFYIQSEKIDVENKKIIYLDFNIFDRMEKDKVIFQKFFELSERQDIIFVYSGTHLEEIIRMNNEDNEKQRLSTINRITKGNAIMVDGNQMISVFCKEDINQRMKKVRTYKNLNSAVEERECILAEDSEKANIITLSEEEKKIIANSSLQKIVEGKNKEIIDKDKLNFILKKVGIGDYTIEQYNNCLEHEKDVNKIRCSICSIAALLNIIGLHSDKIKNKNSEEAVYPIYGKKSYKTIRSGYYDNEHLANGVNCDCFVTCDNTLYKKAKEIYNFLGVKTNVIKIDEVENLYT